MYQEKIVKINIGKIINKFVVRKDSWKEQFSLLQVSWY